MKNRYSPDDRAKNNQSLTPGRFTRDSLQKLSSAELIELVMSVQKENLLLKEHNKQKGNGEQDLSMQLEGEKILAEITSQFINAEVAHNESEIPIALQKMAKYLQADIGFIRFIDRENKTIQKGFDWKESSIKLDDFESFNISVDQFKRTLQVLASDTPIYVPEVQSIPEEAVTERQFLSKTGMASLTLHPIFIFGRFSGYIGFGARKAHPFWSVREKGLLDLFRSTITSIVERQEREKSYIESQELYHRLLELSPNIILLIQEQYLLYTNPAGAQLLGFENPEEIIGKPFEDLISADAIQDFRKRYHKNLREDKVFLAEISFETKQHTKVDFEFSSLPLVIQGKKSFLAEGVDITHRKLIEQEIEGSRQFLNNILNITPLAILVYDHQEKHFSYFNKTTGNILGLSPEQLSQIDFPYFFQMIHPNDQNLVMTLNDRLASLSAGQVIEGEFRLVCSEEETLWLHSYQTALSHKPDGSTIQSLTIIQNITDIKNAQLELKRSEDQYRNLVESIPGIVYLSLCDGVPTTLYVSDYFTKITSYDKKTILDKSVSWLDLIHPEDRENATAEIEKTIQEKTPYEIEYRLRNANGKYVWVVDRGRIIFDENDAPQYYSGIVTDISASKRDFEAMLQLSQENLRLLAQARRDSETKTLLLNEVNHRVKNNIASIIGLIELERDREINSTSDFQLALDSIKSRINGLATVHNILSSNNWAPLKLDLFVQKVVENAASSSPIGRKLAISVHAHDKKIWINSRQATALALILNELTTNTIRHALPKNQNGAITISIHRESRTSNQIHICFADNGPGWPEEIISGTGGNVGMQVIRLSAISPLYGNIKLENNNGAVATITFNLVEQRELFKPDTDANEP